MDDNFREKNESRSLPPLTDLQRRSVLHPRPVILASQTMTGLNPALLEVYNTLASGNYSQVVATAATIKPNQYVKQSEKDDFILHRDIILYRAYIGLRQWQNVISEVGVKKDPAVEFVALKTLAEFHKTLEQTPGSTIDPSPYLEKIPEMSASDLAKHPIVALIRANILASSGMLAEAATALSTVRPTSVSASMSMHSVEVLTTLGDIFLRLHRVDLADDVVNSLISSGLDDLAYVQYLVASVQIVKGDAQSAVTALSDCADRYGRSVRLLNALAVARMAVGEWDAAESLLLEVVGGTAVSPDTYANLATVAFHTGKGAEERERWVSQLRTAAPGHPALSRLTSLNEASVTGL